MLAERQLRRFAVACACAILGLGTPVFAQHATVDLQNRLRDARIDEGADGLTVAVATESGISRLSPEEYVRAIYHAQQDQRSHGALYVLFNITNPWGILWVALGFLGQAMFTLRMVLQWLASEREKRSVIPVGFWWGSLFGGMLLLMYFVWRRDIVGIVGQSTGVFIYARNLSLIYRRRRGAPSSARTPGGSPRSHPRILPT